MLRRILPFTLLGLLAVVGCGKKADDDSSGSEGSDALAENDTGPPDANEYTIRIKDPAPGTTVKGSMKMDMKTTVTASGEGTQNIDIKMDMDFRETPLEKPPGMKRPTRSKLIFDRWTVNSSLPQMGNPEVVRRVVGKEILFTKIGNRYEVRAVDGRPLDSQLEIFLPQMYTQMYEGVDLTDFLPKQPVKRDTPWNAPIKKLTAAAGPLGQGVMAFDETKSKTTGRLIRVRDQDGHKYGRIVLKTTLAVKSGPNAPFQIKDGAKLEMTIITDTCIDGTRHDLKSTVKMQMDMEMVVQGKPAKLKLTGTITTNQAEMKSAVTATSRASEPRSRAYDEATGAERTQDLRNEQPARPLDDAIVLEAPRFDPRPPVPDATPGFERPPAGPGGFGGFGGSRPVPAVPDFAVPGRAVPSVPNFPTVPKIPAPVPKVPRVPKF